jgi:hypothetical protein
MFVRTRRTGARLQLSLIETTRAGGKVRSEHVAALGSVPVSPATADRVAFWDRLHQRLAGLANRLDPEAQGKILGAVHASVPMPTIADQRAVQLENAKADVALWAGLRDMNAATAGDHKALVAKAESKIVASEAEATKAAEHAAAAEGRVARIEKGETVAGGFGAPIDVRQILADAGWTEEDMRWASFLGALGENAFADLLDMTIAEHERAEKALHRAILRGRRIRKGVQ